MLRKKNMSLRIPECEESNNYVKLNGDFGVFVKKLSPKRFKTPKGDIINKSQIKKFILKSELEMLKNLNFDKRYLEGLYKKHRVIFKNQKNTISFNKLDLIMDTYVFNEINNFKDFLLENNITLAVVSPFRKKLNKLYNENKKEYYELIMDSIFRKFEIDYKEFSK